MPNGLTNFVERFLTLVGGAWATSQVLPTLLGNPAGALGFTFIVGGAATAAAYSVYKQKSSEKNAQELASHTKQLLEGELSWLQEAAEHIRIDQQGKLDLSGLADGQRDNPYLIFYKLLTTQFEGEQQKLAAIAGALDQVRLLGRRLIPFVQQHRDELRGLLERQREDTEAEHREHERLEAKIDQVLEQTRAEPPLYVPRVEDASEESRFVYSARRVPLLGREEALTELREFLEDERAVLWWLWTGAGGLGKSRLALELVLEAPWRGWDAGFLISDGRKGAGHDWARWKPTSPTLIVVDYVAQRAEEAGEAIKELGARVEVLGQRVRVLLLERRGDEGDPWVKDFRGTGSRRASVEARRYRESRRLEELRQDDIWGVMENVLRRGSHPLPPKQDALRVFNSAFDRPGQEHRRPLFAAFAAEAIAAYGLEGIRNWSITDLVRSILEREVDRWQKAGIDEKHVNLVVLATLAGGLQRKRAYTLAEQRELKAGA